MAGRSAADLLRSGVRLREASRRSAGAPLAVFLAMGAPGEVARASLERGLIMRSLIQRHSRCRAPAMLAIALLAGLLHGSAQAQTQAAPTREAGAAAASAATEGFFAEPHFIDHTLGLVEQRFRQGIENGGGKSKDGFYPELSNLPTGAGWISAGPGYRHRLFGDNAFVDASAAWSWRAYKMVQARFELPNLASGRLLAGSQVRWQDLTQVTYFGEGPDTSESTRSEYRIKSTNVVGYSAVQATPWLSIGGRAGWLEPSSLLAPAGSFQRGNPDTREVFPDDIVYTIPEQPPFVHGELSVTADTRDHRSRPTGGALYRAAWSRYSDRDTGTFSFRRYEAEGAQFVPLAQDRIVLAIHGWIVGSETSAGEVIPFYLMPSLGGSNTLRAYSDYRFHDRNLLLFTAESRFALFTHVDAALFVDAGNVAARVADLNLDKRGYGAGLRVHTGHTTFARFDVAHGDEGWRFLFRLSDPLHLTRLSPRTAAVPFVP
jgi:hypothetical protein